MMFTDAQTKSAISKLADEAYVVWRSNVDYLCFVQGTIEHNRRLVLTAYVKDKDAKYLAITGELPQRIGPVEVHVRVKNTTRHAL